jgi:hypothetical protein
MKKCLVTVALLALWAQASADLLFNNPNHRIVTANVTGAPTTYPVTVTAIVKLTPTAGTQQVVFQAGRETTAAPNGYLMYFAETNQMNVWMPGPNSFVGTTATMPVGKWVYIAWSLGSTTTQRFYMWNYDDRTTVINVTPAATTGTIAAPVATLKLGVEEANIGVWSFMFLGTIRQVAVYQKDWTASADPFRAMAYLGPYAVATPTLLYNLQEGTGLTTIERRGTGNNGTLANIVAMTWERMTMPRVFPLQ